MLTTTLRVVVLSRLHAPCLEDIHDAAGGYERAILSLDSSPSLIPPDSSVSWEFDTPPRKIRLRKIYVEIIILHGIITSGAELGIGLLDKWESTSRGARQDRFHYTALPSTINIIQ